MNPNQAIVFKYANRWCVELSQLIPYSIQYISKNKPFSKKPYGFKTYREATMVLKRFYNVKLDHYKTIQYGPNYKVYKICSFIKQ